MTGHAVSTVDHDYGWQLVAEFAASSLPGSEGPLLAQVMGAVQRLNLQPLQLERIHEAFGQVVTRAMPSGEPALRVRVWVLGSCAYDCAWGFFLVEKQGNDPESATATPKIEYLVELFLYQERDSQLSRFQS